MSTEDGKLTETARNHFMDYRGWRNLGLNHEGKQLEDTAMIRLNGGGLAESKGKLMDYKLSDLQYFYDNRVERGYSVSDIKILERAISKEVVVVGGPDAGL